MNHTQLSRRQLMTFMGRHGLGVAGLLSHRAWGSTEPFSPVTPSTADELRLAQGFFCDILIKQGDSLGSGLTFGDCCDFTAFVPLPDQGSDHGLLWVNHESVSIFLTDREGRSPKTIEQVNTERAAVGGSFLRVRRSGDHWQVVPNDPLNRRISAATPIPFANHTKILGDDIAIGTLANCSGGTTPWGSILTCEENYQHFYGESFVHDDGTRERIFSKEHQGWDAFYPEIPPEHFGWVVEINPATGKAQKLPCLGCFAHEGAAVVTAADGRPVVYMGDDGENQCIYKFIASKQDSLAEGELFVADTKQGRWLSLSIDQQPILKKAFKDQLDVLINTRKAAQLVGGTPQNRPEDIEQDPVSKAMIISLTNNNDKGDFFGSLLKIEEEHQDPLSLRFKASTFLAGGPKNGFACPDNLVFDGNGNLWMTSDISGAKIGKGDYKVFGNNGLFYIPMSGPHAGRTFMVASAPVGAELTGPSFSPDYRSLFLSVQHPGENSPSPDAPTSRWPDGPGTKPRSSVVVISGALLARLAAPQS